MNCSVVSLSKVLKQYRIECRIVDNIWYRQGTISKYKGVSYRGEKLGKAIGRKRQFVVNLSKFPNTLLFIRQGVQEGGIGIAPIEVDGCIVTENMPMFSIEGVNPKYLNYFLASNFFKSQIKELVPVGSAQKALHEKELLKIKIPLPSPQAQERIVERLDAISEIHSLLLKEIINQELYIDKLKQIIFQDAIQGKLVPQDLTDEPASLLLERIKKEKEQLVEAKQLKKEKPLASIEATERPFELPEGWEWCRLGNITRINSGVTLGKSYKDELVKVPYLRVANVQRGWINIAEIKELNVPQAEIEKYQLKKGDLLMIEGGDWDKVGRCAIWNNEIQPFIHQNHIYCIRSIEGVSNEYLEKYLNSPIAKRYFESCSKQTTNLASINKTQLSNTLVPLPPVDAQQRIVGKVNQLMRLCDEMEQQIIQSKSEAEQLLQAVLREAFEGKHAVPKQDNRQDEVLWQKRLLALYINILMEQHQEQGEMAIAKYAYLNDKLYDAGSGFRYVQHNFGPYSPEIRDCLTAPDALFYKKTVGKKGYEVYHVNKEMETGFIAEGSQSLQEVQKRFRQLMQVFSVVPMQDRARQLELIASICWLIEQKQSTDLDTLYEGLENWPTPKRQIQHKGQLFTKAETATGLQLIQQQGWHLKLLHTS